MKIVTIEKLEIIISLQENTEEWNIQYAVWIIKQPFSQKMQQTVLIT